MSITLANISQAFAGTLLEALKSHWLTSAKADSLIERMADEMPGSLATRRKFAKLARAALEEQAKETSP